MSLSIGQLTYYNVFRKVFIFMKYLSDNISNGEIKLVYASLKYLLLRRSHRKDYIATTNIGRFYLRGRTIDFISANSAYEYPVMNVVHELLTHSDMFIDIGANIGTYSVLCGKRGIRTFAFEPIKMNYDSLCKNIELNDLSEIVTANNFGLSSEVKDDQFNFFLQNPGASSLYNIEFNSKGEKKDVHLEVFDKLEVDELKKCKAPLVKIDVEGMEIEVLKGMEEFIKEKPKISFILETKHSGEETIKEKFNKLGLFSFSRIDPFNLLVIKQ